MQWREGGWETEGPDPVPGLLLTGCGTWLGHALAASLRFLPDRMVKSG